MTFRGPIITTLAQILFGIFFKMFCVCKRETYLLGAFLANLKSLSTELDSPETKKHLQPYGFCSRPLAYHHELFGPQQKIIFGRRKLEYVL